MRKVKIFEIDPKKSTAIEISILKRQGLMSLHELCVIIVDRPDYLPYPAIFNRNFEILTETMANLHKVSLSENGEVFPDLCDMRNDPCAYQVLFTNIPGNTHPFDIGKSVGNLISAASLCVATQLHQAIKAFPAFQMQQMRSLRNLKHARLNYLELAGYQPCDQRLLAPHPLPIQSNGEVSDIDKFETALYNALCMHSERAECVTKTLVPLNLGFDNRRKKRRLEHTI